MTRCATSFVLAIVLLTMAAAPAAPQGATPAAPATAKVVQLPAPRKTGGKPLMDALAERRSGREFDTRSLPPQVLSNLLWAAWGSNRPDGRRTAPSARNWQEMEIYVTLADGLYLYDAKAHALDKVGDEDLRAATGTQPFVGEAPLNLVYVSDGAKIPGNVTEQDRALYSGAHTGLIAQNVYLFCASEGLATVVRGLVPRPELARRMHLRPEQRITLAQTVGYPGK